MFPLNTVVTSVTQQVFLEAVDMSFDGDLPGPESNELLINNDGKVYLTVGDGLQSSPFTWLYVGNLGDYDFRIDLSEGFLFDDAPNVWHTMASALTFTHTSTVDGNDRVAGTMRIRNASTLEELASAPFESDISLTTAARVQLFDILNITDTQADPTSASVYWYNKGDGTMASEEGNGGGENHEYTWLLTGVIGDYEFMFQVDQINGSGTMVSANTDVWNAIFGDTLYEFSTSGLGNDSDVEGTIMIRDIITLEVLATASVTGFANIT